MSQASSANARVRLPHACASLLHELILRSSERDGMRVALTAQGLHVDYVSLARGMAGFASMLVDHGLARHERVAIYLDKRVETVVASFGTAAAGGAFVPVNPLLKPDQVAFILADCDARVLVTSPQRLPLLTGVLDRCPALRAVVLTPDDAAAPPAMDATARLPTSVRCIAWPAPEAVEAMRSHRVIDTDMVAILYTSGSTGRPKGVVLSHRNMVAGAISVASYLGNHDGDALLAALPLSFDAGFSQLTTAFHVGARVVLLNYLVPKDVLDAIDSESVTGLTAVPPLYIQLTQRPLVSGQGSTLRYFANTGGRMPRETLDALRRRWPRAEPFLMYGLTEAFRSTYLPPDQVDKRPDSIGKAIPNAEILVLRDDGTECSSDEPGELVHRGPLVGMGYWNDPDKTAERYRILPGRPGGLPLPEYAVYSGDTVRRDAEGFIYFIGRRDEMIKTSGYRVSPVEVEEVLYQTQLVGECAAFGLEDAALGQSIHVVATPPAGQGTVDEAALLAQCRRRMPAYMVPASLDVVPGPLPRNPNGKIDRKTLAADAAARRAT